MKKVLATAIIAVFALSSCLKQDNKCGYNDSAVTAPESEINNLEDSLAKYGITGAQISPSGFLYTIEQAGTGPGVTNLCSNITVEYKGAFFDGKIFDSTKTGMPAFFQLGGVILGWQKGIPLIKEGGSMHLYVPPTLAYGPNAVKDQTTGAVVIPGNSYLVFEVKVLKIN